VDGGLCLSATTKQSDLAKAYIEFATRDENAKRLLQPLRAFATSHMNVIGESDDISRELRSQLPAAKSLDWIFPVELADFMQREMQAMMGQTQTPEQTAANIQAKYEALVQAGYVYRSTQSAFPEATK
jgi:ABC-type glycerol-3-phosphate transport system substrate-binding protein